MKDRSVQWVRLLLCCLLCHTLPGCGGEPAISTADRGPYPDEDVSCVSLEPLVDQDPLTGGAFHCLICNRTWRWTVPPDTQELFVLIALHCERLRGGAYLEIENAHGASLWVREVEQGDAETHCIRQQDPVAGTLSVRLRGRRDLLLATDLIGEFQGSLYVKVFSERGERLVPAPLPPLSRTEP